MRAFYACSEDSYVNLAILTDGLIIDIETEEDNDSPGDLTVISVKAVAEIQFHEGPVHTIPDSEDALLTLVLSMVGATGVGPYWIAGSSGWERSGKPRRSSRSARKSATRRSKQSTKRSCSGGSNEKRRLARRWEGDHRRNRKQDRKRKIK